MKKENVQTTYADRVPPIASAVAKATVGQPSFAKATADKEKKCINLDYLNQITQKNSESTAEMIDIYLEETPTLVNAMKLAIKNKNWESLRIASHSIIPSFSIMGMDKEFENNAQEIQEYASNLNGEYFSEKEKKESIVKVNGLFLRIEKTCEEAYEALKKELLTLRKTKQTH